MTKFILGFASGMVFTVMLAVITEKERENVGG